MFEKRHALRVWLPFLFLGCLLTGLVFQSLPAAAEEPNVAHRYVAYYFLTNKRCQSCLRIEKWTEASIHEYFKEDLESGSLDWRTVNVQKPENKHFIDDFQLYTKSVVIVEQQDGATIRWHNLDKVWHLLRDQEQFSRYVFKEIQGFMEKS